MGYDMYRITPANDDPDDRHAIPGGYFRLNIWGMAEVRPQLEAVGIARESYFPDPFSETAITGPEGPGICMHKLCSNDGWVVTELEIKSGIAYADAEHPDWRETLDKHTLAFVEWMEASPLGFEVW